MVFPVSIKGEDYPRPKTKNCPYSVFIHLMASVSFTLPRYRWVVARSACRRM